MAQAPNTAPTKDGEKKKPARQNMPRPAYLLLNAPLPEGVEVVDVTRKAEEALTAIDTGKAESYIRVMIK